MSSGCATSREITSPAARRTPWHSTVRNTQPANPAKSAVQLSEQGSTTSPTQTIRDTAQAEDRNTPFKLVAFEDTVISEAVVQVAGDDTVATPASSDVASLANLEQGTPAITLAEIESIALANNPTIRGLNATIQKAAGYRTQVGLRANPTMGYQGVQLADRSTDQHTAFIEQEVVTGGKLELNRRVLGEAVQAQALELEAQRLRITTDVRAQFFHALAAQKRIELIHEFQSVA
ncbi:MAG: TolC family protein, partial [Aureliella sp.]